MWGVPIETLPVLVNGKERLEMEESLSTPLKEQEKFRELFQILDEKGLYEEKGQILNLVDYIDNIDKQFGKVLKELKTVKHHVKKLEERGLKQRLLRTIGALEGKLCAARDELIEVKNQLVDGVHRTIQKSMQEIISMPTEKRQSTKTQKIRLKNVEKNRLFLGSQILSEM